MYKYFKEFVVDTRKAANPDPTEPKQRLELDTEINNWVYDHLDPDCHYKLGTPVPFANQYLIVFLAYWKPGLKDQKA